MRGSLQASIDQNTTINEHSHNNNTWWIILRLKKLNATELTPDVMACFDNLHPGFCAVSTARLGLPINGVLFMLRLLAGMVYYVSTIFGISEKGYCNPTDIRKISTDLLSEEDRGNTGRRLVHDHAGERFGTGHVGISPYSYLQGTQKHPTWFVLDT
jgi:hypothetical protein